MASPFQLIRVAGPSMRRIACRRRSVHVQAGLPPVGRFLRAEEHVAAIHVVERASRMCQAARAGIKGVAKADKTEVTAVDFAVQALVAIELAPYAPLMAEEDADRLRDGGDEPAKLRKAITALVNGELLKEGRPPISEAEVLDAIDLGRCEGGREYFVLDPIDGTRGFLAGGAAQYVVGLALVRENQLVLGVMGLPNYRLASERPPGSPPDAPPDASDDRPAPVGHLLVAARGTGCWRLPLIPGGGLGEPTQTRVDAVGRDGGVAAATICISDRETWTDLPISAVVTPKSVWPVLHGSLCKCAAVALGEATVFLQQPPGVPNYVLKTWDQAAGAICVTEAGGVSTDLAGVDLNLTVGRAFFPNGEGVLMSAGGRVQAELVQALHRCWPVDTGPALSTRP